VDRRRSAQTTRADAHNSGHLASVQLWRLLSYSASMSYQPVPLQKRALPFDDPNFIYELKYVGFRAPAVIDRRPELVSRNGNSFASFADLANQIAEHLPANAALDGEIVAVDRKGKPRFNDLMFHRRPPCFFAFDLLTCDGRDWRSQRTGLLTQDKKEHLLGYILILQDDYHKVTFLNCLTGHGGGSGEPVARAV
jgi:bifunctional non-homologous end joining protein LigD